MHPSGGNLCGRNGTNLNLTDDDFTVHIMVHHFTYPQKPYKVLHIQVEKEKEFLLGHDANQMIDRDERTRLSYAI